MNQQLLKTSCSLKQVMCDEHDLELAQEYFYFFLYFCVSTTYRQRTRTRLVVERDKPESYEWVVVAPKILVTSPELGLSIGNL